MIYDMIDTYSTKGLSTRRTRIYGNHIRHCRQYS